MARTRITIKGQTTIPKSLRDRLHLKPGDRVEIAVYNSAPFVLKIKLERLIPLAPALPTFGDERAIGARLQPATDKMLIAPEAAA